MSHPVLADTLSVAVPTDWRAAFSLCKPRLSALVLCTTGVGLYLGNPTMVWPRALLVLFATAVVVGAANALNCYFERHTDALMHRTRQRALCTGRVDARQAFWGACAAAVLAMSTLYWAGGPLCALLSFVAFALYAFVYTPMKRVNAGAMLVGAIPGAIPPLLGHVAATQKLTLFGGALFGLLFFWQLPHFLAVAAYLKDDYRRGGLKVLPLCCTPRQTVAMTFACALLLLPASLLPFWTGRVHGAYALFALALGGAFAAFVGRGFFGLSFARWARQVFLFSIAQLTLLLTCLLAGAKL